MKEQVIKSFACKTQNNLEQEISEYSKMYKLKVKLISAYSDNEKYYSERAIVVFES